MKKLIYFAFVAFASTAHAASFDFRLYQELAKAPGNIVLSPYSVLGALEMTGEGAKGATRDEFLKSLGWDGKTALPALPEGVEGGQKIWGNNGAPFKPDFITALHDKYHAELTALDFTNDPEGSRKSINDWVSGITKGKIGELIGPGAIQKSTELVLTTALYFKGAWMHAFSPYATKNEDFHGAKKTARTAMMHQTENLSYAEDANFQALRLPYVGGHTDMLIFLPQKGKRISALTEKEMKSLRDKLKAREVQVSLPKFRAEFSAELSDTLKQLGLRRAFTPQADFSGMRDLNPGTFLYITNVVHKAYVDVDEKGTEAAAATGVVMTLGAAYIQKPKPVVFRADHPFTYVIESSDGNILFMGKVEQP